MKAANFIIFQKNNRGFNSAKNVSVIWIKYCNEYLKRLFLRSKCVHKIQSSGKAMKRGSSKNSKQN